ncbi:unnamed protein product [Kuraishia capsulata CBS 1993]|uniref:Zn(2)-C6 fungal-type domain-containing protein n=1 Tax=Kuraishia capsulata CBS 1993 TaxID=1382522 RepID=W6MTB3_9ASCO|nr:uncharacterized protein KUCA_T00006056001 [Kuraishia capsulata CBS 1993]CDK30061.1 unnamed protein product [Kuraishia capsulata CBS 1993]
MELPKKRTRRKHSNSHFGCSLCKKRKIKCDEGLPSCANCVAKKSCCPYLDMTSEEMEQFKHYKEKKARQSSDITPTSSNPFSARSPPSSDLTSPDTPPSKQPRGLSEYSKVENISIECKQVEHEIAQTIISTHFFYMKSMTSSELFEEGVMDSFTNPHANFFQLVVLLSIGSTMNYNCCIAFAGNYSLSVTRKPYLQPYCSLLSFPKPYVDDVIANCMSRVYRATADYVSKFAQLKDLQIFMLVASTFHLMYNSLYYSDNLKQYNKFINGMTAFLAEDIVKEEALSVNPFLVVAEVMIQNFKKMYFPVYPSDFLGEISFKLEQFRLEFGSQMSLSETRCLEDMQSILERTRIVANGNQSGLVQVLPSKLFALLESTISSLPPSIFNVGFDADISDVEFVIYAFIMAIVEAQRAVLPGVSFLFCSEFMGLEDSPDRIRSMSVLGSRVAEVADSRLKDSAIYASRVASFLKKRRHLLDRIFLVREPFTPMDFQKVFQDHDLSRLDEIISESRRMANTTETTISSFGVTPISIENYPKIVDGSSFPATNQVMLIPFEDGPETLDFGNYELGSHHLNNTVANFDRDACLLKTDFDADNLKFPKTMNLAVLLNNKVVIHATLHNLNMIEMIRSRLLSQDN